MTVETRSAPCDACGGGDTRFTCALCDGLGRLVRLDDKRGLSSLVCAKGTPYVIVKNLFDANELDRLEALARAERYRPVPEWLGNFNFAIFRRRKEDVGNYKVLSNALLPFVHRLEALVPSQRFDTVFLQRYERTELVYEHADPKNNVGVTMIAPCGRFRGAKTTVGKESFQVKPGEALVQRCMMSDGEGKAMTRPRHSVSPVAEGTRYALILNTIVRTL